MDDLKPGEVFDIPYPFVREPTDVYTIEDGWSKELSWRPGLLTKSLGSDGSYAYAHDMGAQILTVVSTHKPGKYQTRVFYLRSWRDPEGKEFGKPRLRVTAVAAFRRLLKGYRHEFELEPYRAPEPDPITHLLPDPDPMDKALSGGMWSTE